MVLNPSGSYFQSGVVDKAYGEASLRSLNQPTELAPQIRTVR